MSLVSNYVLYFPARILFFAGEPDHCHTECCPPSVYDDDDPNEVAHTRCFGEWDKDKKECDCWFDCVGC